MEVKDVQMWVLAGRPRSSELVRTINEIKKRVDGFIYGGRDTFNRLIKEFALSGKPVQYNKHNLTMNLNYSHPPKLMVKVRMDAFSEKVKLLRDELCRKFKF
jgi:hypothetical protein